MTTTHFHYHVNASGYETLQVESEAQALAQFKYLRQYHRERGLPVPYVMGIMPCDTVHPVPVPVPVPVSGDAS